MQFQAVFLHQNTQNRLFLPSKTPQKNAFLPQKMHKTRKNRTSDAQNTSKKHPFAGFYHKTWAKWYICNTLR